MTAIEDARQVVIRTDEPGRESWAISLTTGAYTDTLRMTESEARLVHRALSERLAPLTDDEREALAERAEERGQGICRTCLAPIWNEGGTIGHEKRAEGWSDRVEQGGDSLVCFKANRYRHVPLTGREAAIYDTALRRQGPITAAQVECPHWEPGRVTLRNGCTACAALEAARDAS